MKSLSSQANDTRWISRFFKHHATGQSNHCRTVKSVVPRTRYNLLRQGVDLRARARLFLPTNGSSERLADKDRSGSDTQLGTGLSVYQRRKVMISGARRPWTDGARQLTPCVFGGLGLMQVM